MAGIVQSPGQHKLTNSEANEIQWLIGPTGKSSWLAITRHGAAAMRAAPTSSG